MDSSTFDRWARAISSAASRRQALLALASGLPGLAEARNKKRRKNRNKRKIKRNAFGCVGVGNLCKNGGQCCSGICAGKKDKKKCKGHDAVGCQTGQQETICGGAADVPCMSSSGEEGFCGTTTGNAGYCTADGGCLPCTKDADCVPFCGPEAACLRCEGLCENSELTVCAGVRECVGLPN